MQGYIIRRLFLFIPTLIIASLVIFAIMRVIPGDVALIILGASGESSSFNDQQYERLREQLGLNENYAVQYGTWAWSMIKGDFGGLSLEGNRPIRSLVARRLPVTLQLTFYSMAISILISLPLGVLAAIWQDRIPDYVIRIFSIAGASIPNFYLALLLILGLSVYFNWTPPLVYKNLWEDPSAHFQKMVWPSIVLAWGYSSYIIRVTRSNMLEVLRQDYIRTARSKGLGEINILWRHALRNALIPVVTIAGIYVGSLLGGTVILERIFSLPGIGNGIVSAATGRDYPVIQSYATLLVFLMLIINLGIDLLYVVFDPRISYSTQPA